MLTTLNLLIPTLQDCASRYDGEFEKNTGDGILVHFGMGAAFTDASAVHRATFAAHAMLWAVKMVINPELTRRELKPVNITIGADIGDVLLARIGVARGDNPLVAVGVAANRAAKIQGRCSPGQFRVGEDYYKALPKDLRQMFRTVGSGENWPFRVAKTDSEYRAEVADATLRARQEEEQRRLDANRTGGLSFLGMPMPPPPMLPVFPESVNRYRLYRVYTYAGVG